jgi:GNAT superfamily N-acetyltransferase
VCIRAPAAPALAKWRETRLVTSLSIRRLAAADTAVVETLLAGAPDSTMFLRANIRHGGFAYEGSPRQAKYFGAFDGDELAGIAALCWNGMVLFYAPRGVEALFVAVVREAMDSGGAISGVNGCSDQLFPVCDMLDLGALPILFDPLADRFALDLSQLQVPDRLGAPGVTLRTPGPGDLDVLVDWEIGFRTEALEDCAAQGRRGEIERNIGRALERGIDNMWLLQCDGVPVARAVLNAHISDSVQVGGVWTTPGERGKGYGRAVVAGCLQAVTARGVGRAVLVAHDPRAIHAYTAIGFRKVGGDMLVLFAEPVAPERIWRLTNAAPHLAPIAA